MKISLRYTAFGLIALIFVLQSCKKEEVPTLETATITNITGTTAVSGGEIKDEGSGEIVERGICWSKNDDPTISDNKSSDGAGVGKFVSNMSDLEVATSYFVRAYAANDAGIGYGTTKPFRTSGRAPDASTLAAANITATSSTLRGAVNANYVSATVTFEYGTTTGYGQTITATPGSVTGSSDTEVSAEITGLTPGAIYHYRVKTSNSLGTTVGEDMSFTTLGQAPGATTRPACCLTPTGAKLNGTVNANYVSTVVTFEYGLTTSYGSSVTATPAPLTGNSSTSVSAVISGLNSSTTYHFRIKAVNSLGTTFGSDMMFSTSPVNSPPVGQIIADHTVVDRFDDIPSYYLDEVKKMWFVIAGESHSVGYIYGLNLLEELNNNYSVNSRTTGTPEGYTTSYLRASRATWGDFDNETGWIYYYGEEDWFTSAAAIARTKAGITYCNTNSLEIAAIGFGWCYDPAIEFGEGISAYLNATQQYIDYCAANNYSTKVFFTTGPVDDIYTGLFGYNNHLRYEQIRDYVEGQPTAILFDYADILCYDDDSETPYTTTYNAFTYPVITINNSRPNISSFHTSEAGTIRLAKAVWWMLARIAGWDGN